MWTYVKYVILGAFLIETILGIYIFIKRSKTYVLSEKIAATESPTPSPTPSPSPSPTPTPTLVPTQTPKSLPTPTPVPPAEINAQIDRFSGQYAVDPNVMRHIAICESGFNPLAVNGPYAGLYQFGKITWKNLREEIGEDTKADLRFSAEESAQTAAYALAIGKRGIWPNCAP